MKQDCAAAGISFNIDYGTANESPQRQPQIDYKEHNERMTFESTVREVNSGYGAYEEDSASRSIIMDETAISSNGLNTIHAERTVSA